VSGGHSLFNTMSADKKLLDAALEQMRALEDSRDLEGSHIEADDILCDLLDQLGFNEVVEAFKKLPKWYA